MKDKELERQRYENRAREAFSSLEGANMHSGAVSVRPILRAPYEQYEAILFKVLRPEFVVLEIGSGTGEFTQALLKSGATVVATDISARSLELLKKRYAENINLYTITCDMEYLPFPDGLFDVAACAGSLSYGDNQLVLHQIHRVLKPGGCFVCVDSLNHNPLYRINRYIHFLRGKRSYSTLQRMPRIELIKQYQIVFLGGSFVCYFGGFSWLFLIFAKLGFEFFLANTSNVFDRLCMVRRSAFKFVLMVRKAL